MITLDLIHNVLDVRYSDFSAQVIQDAKNQILDLVATMVGGADASGNHVLLELVRQWGGQGEATILGHGDKVPLPHAAMMNSLQCRSYDHEAVGPYPFGQNKGMFCGHVESSTVPAALAIAEHIKANGKELISAVVLGGDMAARIVFVEGIGFKNHFDPVGTANAFGVAGVAARLLGLNENQLLNALGIVSTQVAGGFQSLWEGVQTFKLFGAMSARNGITAALMAKKGFTSIKDPLFGHLGYFECYSTQPIHPEYLSRDLGKEFYVKGMHKKYPSCYANHNLIDCGLDILNEYDINSDDIGSVIIGVPQIQLNSYGAQIFKQGDSQQAALFYMSYSVASVLFRKGVKLAYYTEEAVKEPSVVELAGKIVFRLTQQNNIASELIVRMKTRKEIKTSYQYPAMRGYPDRPLTHQELIEKYWNNINFYGNISQINAQKALDLIEHLEEVDDISKICKLLVSDNA